jgi:hypothetical protein
LANGNNAHAQALENASARTAFQDFDTDIPQTIGKLIRLEARTIVARFLSEPGASNIMTENNAGTMLSMPNGTHAIVVPRTIDLARPALILIA